MMAYVYCARSLLLSNESPLLVSSAARCTESIMSLNDWHFFSVLYFCHSSKTVAACGIKKLFSKTLLMEGSNSFNALKDKNASYASVGHVVRTKSLSLNETPEKSVLSFSQSLSALKKSLMQFLDVLPNFSAGCFSSVENASLKTGMPRMSSNVFAMAMVRMSSSLKAVSPNVICSGLSRGMISRSPSLPR